MVDTADATEALSLALDRHPDCILLDLLMPGLTGFELCKTLSSLSLTERIPILVLSGNPVEQFRDYCSHLGAEDYFQKPIDFVRLRLRINQLINERLIERRPELRVKMQVSIELRGLNRFGKVFHEVTSTQDISVTGFRCACAAPLGQKSVVEVFLRGGSAKRRWGVQKWCTLYAAARTRHNTASTSCRNQPSGCYSRRPIFFPPRPHPYPRAINGPPLPRVHFFRVGLFANT